MKHGKNEYNNFGKLSKTVEPYEIDGTLTSTQKILQYNSLGNMVCAQNMMNTASDNSDDICDLYSYNVVSSRVEDQCQQRYNSDEVIITYASYDENGNVISTTDGNNTQTTYQYDELDRMKFSTVTAGGVAHNKRYDYDLNGNLVRTKEYLGENSACKIYKYKYDPLNRLYEKTDSLDKVYEKLEYNARNLQDKSYDAYNKLTEYEYDGNRRLVSTTDPRQHEVNLEYDNMGNVRAKQDGEGNRITYKYDILGRLEQTYNDNSTTTPITSYTYYIDGTLKEQIIDVYTTTYYYNSLGKLKKVCAPNGIGVSSKTEEYEYTATGLLKEKLDREGNTTTYEYDCHGRMISQLAGDSSTYVQVTVPNEVTDMGYDGNGNLKKIIVETKENGVLKSRVTTQRIYDELNRVKTKTETSVDGNSNTVVMGPVTYNYDITTGLNAGEVKEQGIYPGSNSVDKVYDAAGRLKTVTSDGETTQYEYYDDGRRESVTYNNNFRQEYTYYDDGLLDTLTNEVKDSQGVFVESEYYKYDYDGAHNMTQKQERLKRGAIKTTSYDYDCMNRLENIYKPDGTIAYTFDLRGNRDTEIETDTATNEVTYTKYQYTDDNRLQFVTKREDNQSGNIIQRKYYAYDNNGNLTNAYDVTSGLNTITTNTYTLLNQLKTSITAGINEQMENTYNAEGRRVAKTVGGTTARYFYEYGDVAFEYTNSGTISAFNVIGTNLISRETGSDKVYYFCNGHGDVTALLDATTNNIRSQYNYDEFGNITTETYYDSTGAETTDENDIIKSQVLYAGYQYDEESKYYNLQSRYYDPQIARFLQQDTYTGTIDDPLSLNLYAYCHNEPIMYTDPTGHWRKGDPNAKEAYLRINDSDRPVAVQLALMKLSDDWNNESNLGKRAKIAADADAVRREGENHQLVKNLVSKYFACEIDGISIMNSLEVIDKKKEAIAFSDGKVTLDEWKEMKNISSNFMFKRGTTPPKETYSYSGGDYPIQTNTWGSKKDPEAKTMANLVAANTFLTVGAVDTRFIYYNGSRILLHYLQNSGEDYNFKNFYMMNREDKNAKANMLGAIDDVRDATESLAVADKPLQIVSIFEYRNSGVNGCAGGSGFNDWILSIFNYRAWTSASVETRKDINGNLMYTMDMSYNLRDNYRFYGEKTDNPIDDYWYQQLHMYGLAQEFKVYGSDKEQISWKQGHDNYNIVDKN